MATISDSKKFDGEIKYTVEQSSVSGDEITMIIEVAVGFVDKREVVRKVRIGEKEGPSS